MDKFFATPELRSTVFTFLRLSKDLFHCAQACRSWKDDALDIRWRFRDVGLRELMGQLAPMEEEEEYGSYHEYWVYNRLQVSLEEVDKDRWTAFLGLAAKIHILSISTFFLHPDSIKLIQDLIKTHGGPLFLNIREIKIYSDDLVVPMVCLALTPGLISVGIDGTDRSAEQDGFEEIFSQVAQSCPAVKTLTIWTECAESGPTFNAFPELTSLEYSVGFFSVESWKSLTECRKLVALKLSGVEFEGDSESLEEEDLEFSALKDLHFHQMEKEDVQNLLTASKMPRLQKLRLEEVTFGDDEKESLSDTLKGSCPDFKQIEFIVEA
ncbi:hypothetical protein FRB90_004612 [Tulasnella sp. 427]|nr:hypothetical protein FRB90_004612 [Tulasnella sp. 427]